ncbi:SMP-30/gluconolactonase/LRE family protein [Ferrimonas lipolytica]|uniref:SMP-30/gluconolactonase/LRE family protein n=1 Tax=Ferrimonas lipolytica TaxID=2724191 RepID=A0A6H1UAP2_9GAMM|nr:SMP-30/gluconolactonase/LRE family protein [Ferrimonas lipolytica]QIZ76137.1 SMP-30/gluconolactonase/LRE family protein [Ferrimonas lipolytica]
MSAWKLSIASLLVATLVYLSSWPVPINPMSWQPPSDRGYQAPFSSNQQLAALTTIATPFPGPETLAADNRGKVYFGLSNGDIGCIINGELKIVSNTGGRPLGLQFDRHNNLYIADAHQGLLRLEPNGTLTKVLTEVGGQALIYANSVAIAADGTLYLSESTTRHAAQQYGTYQASMIDVNEHAGSGRVIQFDPVTGTATVILTGLNFANGVALADNDRSLLVAETGHYRVLKLHLKGDNQGQAEVLLDNLPGFPDNLSRADDGTYWLGLVSPRNALLDWLANKPQLRKMIQRLPATIRPQATRYGHVVGFDQRGQIRFNLQDPQGGYAHVTGALLQGDTLYLSSLHQPAIALLPWPLIAND